MISLLGYGCPPAAIVATFGLDPRTVDDWWTSSGAHNQQVHAATVCQGRLDLQQVQLDEIRHKVQGAVIWIAMAIAVPTRLWLGAAVNTSRDKALLVPVVLQVRAAAVCRPLLICFDGLKAYVTVCRQVFRTPCHTGQVGRPRLIPWPDLCLGRVVKQYARRRVVGVTRHLVQGIPDLASQLIARSQGRGVLNTAFIERVQATFRSRLAWLGRRTRHLAQRVEKVDGAVYLVGCIYNFCTYHDALRELLYVAQKWGGVRQRGIERTPAMAAGLTDHRWTVWELLRYRVPPSVKARLPALRRVVA